ncbi:MAG: protein translocase subunit SecD [bacterium]|nr:protein translocase subunit SecD [bacterium]
MKRQRLFLIITVAIAIIAGNLAYPNYLNKGIDFANSVLGSKIPHFWDVPFKLGLDLQGGIHLLYEADLSGIEQGNYKTAMEGLRDIIERRINYFGVSEPLVQTQDTGSGHRLVVELAGIKDPAQAIKMIGQTPFLEFKEQRTEEEQKPILDKRVELEGKTQEEIQKVENWQLAFEDADFKPTDLTGRYLKKSDIGFDQTTGSPVILLQFNDEGSELFSQITERNVNKMLAIYIDGVPISAPMVQEKIEGGQARITGSFSVEEAKSLVRNLNAGALPVPITLISQQSVGPTLGMVSLRESLKAGIIGFILVIIFMIIYYKLPGIVASIALGIYIALNLSFFKIAPVTLTLAGLGGFILSIGMAVDANVLIFARLKEELKQGKSFAVALEEGFRRSWSAILDGNVTIMIVALILFVLGTSFIKGFALTLIIGTIISMFSAIFITKTLLKLFVGSKLENIKWIWG